MYSLLAFYGSKIQGIWLRFKGMAVIQNDNSLEHLFDPYFWLHILDSGML